jgi:hypothetical protein
MLIVFLYIILNSITLYPSAAAPAMRGWDNGTIKQLTPFSAIAFPTFSPCNSLQRMYEYWHNV